MSASKYSAEKKQAILEGTERRKTDDDLEQQWAHDEDDEIVGGKRKAATTKIRVKKTKKEPSKQLERMKERSRSERKKRHMGRPDYEVAGYSAEEQAAIFWYATEAWMGKMTQIEKDKIEPQTEHFSANTAGPIADFIKGGVPNWETEFKYEAKRKSTSKKGPVVLVVCQSADRALEVIKPLREFKCRIAKLFSKHMKIEEQRDQLAKEVMPIAVGTPNRLQKLVETGGLNLEDTAMILIDMEKNVKKFCILESKDTAVDLVALYYGNVLQERLEQGAKTTLLDGAACAETEASKKAAADDGDTESGFGKGKGGKGGKGKGKGNGKGKGKGKGKGRKGGKGAKGGWY
jgi:uncharacterized membrane protein YgcG